MQIEFQGKTVVVTGAAHGFGRAIALAFAQRGAQVWACDRLADELAETARLSAEAGGVCNVRTVDIIDRDAIFAFVREVEANSPSGQVDILVNNAGGVAGQVGRPLEEVSLDEWNVVIAINMSAAFFFAQAAAPGMKRARWGRIVNISSGAGLGPSLTGIQAYAAAKAGQINLTRQLSHELGEFNITVNNVAPGFVRSNPTTEKQWESYGEEGQKALIERIAMRRLGTVEAIAYAVLFFASDYADWISGQVLPVDGGK